MKVILVGLLLLSGAFAYAEELFHYFLQVGAYSVREDAFRLAERLSGNGVPANVSARESDGRILYRVRVGPFREVSAAEAVKSRLDAESRRNASVVRIGDSLEATASGACPANLQHIAPKLPVYEDQLLKNVRQSVLNEDIAAVMSKIRAAGLTPSQGASRMLADAKEFEELAVKAEECVRAVTTTPEPVLQSLRQGTYQMGTRGTIQDNCAKSYVNAYYGAVGSRELAVVVACHAAVR